MVALNAPVIGDNNWSNFVRPPRGFSKGYRGMWEPGCAAPKTFADIGIPLIPESEWDDRIRQHEIDQTREYDLSMAMGLPCKDQNGTNYCWVNSPTYCCDVIRLRETGRVIRHSPASAGAPIKNFSNSGGWGSQALEHFKANGLNLTEDWPDNAIKRSYYTDENREKAKVNIVLEYFKLDSWVEMGSCILAGIPTANGYNWWSHEVTGAVLKLQSHDLLIRNSWSMSWGDKGYGWLTGSRRIPNDCVAITAMMPI